MGRPPASNRVSEGGLNKGPWTEEEDAILAAFIKANGEGNWRTLPKFAGLHRCRKSCRLRWMNYLRPDLKRGNFSPDEDELIVKLHSLLGNRWSLIAGRIPGRTDNEIKNYWNSRLRRKQNTGLGGLVEATPLSCSALDSVVTNSSGISIPTNHTTSFSCDIIAEPSFPGYAERLTSSSSLDLSMLQEYSGIHISDDNPASGPCSSSDVTACLEDGSDHQSLEAGYYSSWTSVATDPTSDSVKHESDASSPKSVLPQRLDLGDDFSCSTDFISFAKGLADLGEANFRKLLFPMPLSPLHKNLVTMSWPADTFWS